jgi:hypothetical protein
VTTNDVICNVEIEDDYAILIIHVGMTQISMYMERDHLEGIRRIIGGW